MVNIAESSVKDVDVIVLLVEPSTFIGKGEKHIFEVLRRANVPVILVINKTDTVAREEILLFIDKYRKEFDFDEIIPLSAKTGDGCDVLIDEIFKYLPYGDMYFDVDTITDQPERAIVAELIREKALHALDEEIPHGIAVAIDSMKYREKSASKKDNGSLKENKKNLDEMLAQLDSENKGTICDIDATIVCEKDSHKGIIIGKGGAMLKKIGTNARFEIERLIDCKVNLKLWVKVKKDWRDSDYLIKNYGYSEDD